MVRLRLQEKGALVFEVGLRAFSLGVSFHTLETRDIDMNRIRRKDVFQSSPSRWYESRDISKSTSFSLLYSTTVVRWEFELFFFVVCVPVWSCKFHDVSNIVNKLSSPSPCKCSTFLLFSFPHSELKSKPFLHAMHSNQDADTPHPTWTVTKQSAQEHQLVTYALQCSSCENRVITSDVFSHYF